MKPLPKAEVACGLGNAKSLWDVKSRVESTKAASCVFALILSYSLISLHLHWPMNGGEQGVHPVLDGHYNPVAMGLVRSRVICYTIGWGRLVRLNW